MLNKTKNILIFALIFNFLFFACKKNNQNTESQQSVNKQDTTLIDPNSPTLVKFRNKVFSVPSPIQTTRIAKNLNIPYEENLVNPTDNYAKYLTTFKQAVNLGVYGADLAYLNIYDQISEVGQYFQVVRKLAEDLNLLNSISEQTLDRIEKNKENKDSLAFIMSTLFRDIDAYLTENDLQKLGVIILAGGWIESMYILINLYEIHQSDQLLEKIGEQKTPLNNLIQLLEPYYGQGDNDLDKLYEQLAEIASYFDAIELQYTYEGIENYPDKNLTVIKSITTVNISDLDLQNISEKIKSLRNWIIN